MEKLPLFQCLNVSIAPLRLIGRYARLYCGDLFPVLNGMMDNADYCGDLELADGYHLAVWLAHLDAMFPGSTPETRTHLLYRYIVAPFVQINKKET